MLMEKVLAKSARQASNVLSLLEATLTTRLVAHPAHMLPQEVLTASSANLEKTAPFQLQR